MKRLLLCALVASACRASVIAPPTLTFPCDGYTLSAACEPGTIVWFLWEPPFGLVPITEMVKYGVYAELPPDVVVPVPPAYVPPVVVTYTPPRDEPPTVAATPEPGTLLLVFGGFVALIARRRR